jgi:hypothetical protein
LTRQGANVEIRYPRLANRRIELQWSVDLSNPAGWQFLHVPENRPYFSSTNGETRLSDVVTDGPRFYRGRVFEP